MSDGGQRMVPYYCPYCGGEDLRPHAGAHGAWECRECVRVFALKFVGLLARTDVATPSGGDDGAVA